MRYLYFSEITRKTRFTPLPVQINQILQRINIQSFVANKVLDNVTKSNHSLTSGSFSTALGKEE